MRSRNINHWRAIDEIKALLGERPLVLDREFSYLEMLQYMADNGLNFVIRLNLGSHPPILLDGTGKRISLIIAPGQQTNLEPKQGLGIYLQRMKISEPQNFPP